METIYYVFWDGLYFIFNDKEEADDFAGLWNVEVFEDLPK